MIGEIPLWRFRFTASAGGLLDDDSGAGAYAHIGGYWKY